MMPLSELCAFASNNSRKGAKLAKGRQMHSDWMNNTELPNENKIVHKKLLLTYLRFANKRLCLLINFGTELIKDGISRVVNGLPE